MTGLGGVDAVHVPENARPGRGIVRAVGVNAPDGHGIRRRVALTLMEQGGASGAECLHPLRNVEYDLPGEMFPAVAQLNDALGRRRG